MKELEKLGEEGQVAAYRLLLADQGVITLSAEERQELSRYAAEWLARCEPTTHRLVQKVVLPPLLRRLKGLREPTAAA